MSDTDRLKDKLKNLRLSGMLHHLDTTLDVSSDLEMHEYRSADSPYTDF